MPSLASEPFIHLRARGSEIEVEGLSRCFLGYALPEANASEGVFAEWHWDGRDLVVRNDCYGLQPLFYFAGAGEVCLAPMLWTLLEQGAPRDLDESALAVFCRLGFFLGDDTPFRHIKALPPNATFRWNTSGLTLSGNRPKAARVAAIGRAEALDVYQELFIGAVRRRVPDAPFASLLSGGRDSRHILFELMRQGHKPDLAVTVALPTSTDATVSARIAKELGLTNLIVPATRPSIAGELRRIRETHFCADEHGWIFDLRDALRRRVGILYDGLGGDVLSAGLFLNAEALKLMREGRFLDTARRLIAEENVSAFVAKVFRDEAGAGREEEAVARIAQELALHADEPNPLGSFFFWNRTRREIALSPFSIFRTFRVYVPFLDHALFDFLTSLPAEHFVDHSFHDEALARSYPHWAHLPYATKGDNRFSWQKMRFARQTLKWLRGHPCDRLDRRYLMPRLARAAIDPWFSRRSSIYLTNLPIYRTCLEAVCNGKLETLM
jgi:asparagine synthase (glutamine-hydrolysing)